MVLGKTGYFSYSNEIPKLSVYGSVCAPVDVSWKGGNAGVGVNLYMCGSQVLLTP
jgi:hypothetical protein